MQALSRRAFALFLTVVVPAFTNVSRAAAQEEAQREDAAQAEPEADATATTDDTSPRAAMQDFLQAGRAGDYQHAARYLDLAVRGDRLSADGPLLARRLNVVLAQTVWVDPETMSGDPEGQLDDGLRPELERVATIETPRGPVEITLRRDPGTEVPWKFSPATVARIPALYDEFGYGALGEVLPEQLFRVQFMEVQLWQWLGLLLLVFVAYFASWAIVWFLYLVVRPLVARTASKIDDHLLDLFAKPARFGVALALFAAGVLVLRLALPVHRFVLGLQKGLAVLVVAWLFLRLIDVLAKVLKDRLQREGKFGAMSVLPLGEKTLKVIILAFAFLALLQNLGFDATGLIAGLGIGGLALALAAQKTVENLFGGVSVVTDQPVRVGEFCRFGDRVGTVEEIGLRSTKVRTLDRTVVAVPNAEFASMQIENFARRDKIRFTTVLGLRYETKPDQLRWVLAEIRKLLLSHPRVDPEPGRVRFVSYGDYSLNVEIFSFVKTTDINDYLAVQEDLLLRIMDIVAESGTGFAFPSSTTYLARDGGNDAERTEKTESLVAAWREKGEVPVPDYAVETRTRFAGSLAYPPQGSALAQAQAKS
jgi:MscS family membrane protein